MSSSLIAPVVDHHPAPFREPSAVHEENDVSIHVGPPERTTAILEGRAAVRFASPPHRSAAAAMIRGLGGRTESAVRRELDRFFAARPDMSHADRVAIARAMSRFRNQLLHHPRSTLRAAAAADPAGARHLIDAVRSLFNLHDALACQQVRADADQRWPFGGASTNKQSTSEVIYDHVMQIMRGRTRCVQLPQHRLVAAALSWSWSWRFLALTALIGVTFATLAGQGKINARNFALSVLNPSPSELMDFALQQLIVDTGDVRQPCGAIASHATCSATMPAIMATSPATLPPVPRSSSPISWPWPIPPDCTTSRPISLFPHVDPTFYGYNFTRWTFRLSYTGNAIPRPVDQTFEILYDNFQSGDTTTAFSNSGFHILRVTPADATTELDNPTAAANNGLAAWRNFLVQPQASAARFILDGRRLHAFNGPGMGANAVYGNFRYNGGLLSGNASLIKPGNPDAVGMDEDYDACDLENWFLAIQSADGQVIIPSFHRPGIIRYDPKTVSTTGPVPTRPAIGRTRRPASSGRSRPTAMIASTFPDLVPDPATGKINFDVDNDADGVTDSVWLDLGYPARPDSGWPAVQAVIRLHGHRPQRTDPTQHRRQLGRRRRHPRRASRHLC